MTPATAAAASSVEWWAIIVIRFCAMVPVINVVSVTPLPSMPTPILAKPSAPVFETVLQCVANASSSACPCPAPVPVSGVLARMTI